MESSKSVPPPAMNVGGSSHLVADVGQEEERGRIFVAFFENATYPMIAESLDGTITAWNPAAERLYGYPAAIAISSKIGMIIPTDRTKEHRAILRKVLNDDAIEDFDTVRVARNGRKIDVSLSVRPVKSCAGDIIGISNITRDLTAKRFNEEKFRLAVEACPSGMVMVANTGRIVMANREIERMFGYRLDELIGERIDILVSESLRPQHIRYREGFARKPEARRMGMGRDLFGRRKNGSEFPVEVILNPIETPDGFLVLGIVVDISERKRVEHLKDEFVSTVSHELRTPLTSISASLALLAHTADARLPEAMKRLIAIAHSNSQRLVRLINDILDIEKIESGKVVFKLRCVDVRPLIAQAIETSCPLADSGGVKLRFEEAPLHEVHTDPDRFMQVITNLLSNAIRFSPPQAEVVVAVEESNERVRITVRDHGPGIPEDFRSRIFEKFAQANSSNSRQVGGTGLGLSIVKQIVMRLGGEVGFSEAPGSGTIFYVELPRLHSPGMAVEVSNEGPRVLLCEADADAGAVMVDRFAREGFTTDIARTAAVAIAKAKATTYLAILVDLQLPDGDGISLIQQFREQPQHGSTLIVVVSANPGRGRGDLRSSSLNVVDWLNKPLDMPRLLRTLHESIARHGVARPNVLHLDDDPNVLGIVAHALDPTALVVSVTTAADALRALAANHFDLAILDLTLQGGLSLDLLPRLHNSTGEPIPVIVYSADGANPACAAKAQAALTKSRNSIDSLVAIVRRQATIPSPSVLAEAEQG